MSKYFDQARKAQQWAHGEGAPKDVGVQQMLDTLKEAHSVAGDVGGARLRNCRKIRLAYSGDLPLVTGGNEFTDVAMESYRSLRTRLLHLQTVQGFRSVVISSAIQGEGKTLTGLNLALCCAQLHNVRVLLIDGDLRTSGLSRLLGLPAKSGLAEVLAGRATPEEALLSTELPSLFAVGAGTLPSSAAELYASSRWKEFIGWCSESFKIILVDAPPILHLADFELITAGCDGILVVVRALHTQRELLQKAAAQVDAKKLLGVVYNAITNGHRSPYYQRYYPEGVKEK